VDKVKETKLICIYIKQTLYP